MVVQMTRKEYESVYGAKPVLPSLASSSADTFEPTPIPMTRTEYNRVYGKKAPEPSRGLGIKETFTSGIENIKSGLSKTFNPPAIEETKPEVDETALQTTLRALFTGIRAGTESVAGLGRTVGGIAQVGLAPVLGPSMRAGEIIGEKIGEALPVSVGAASESLAQNKIAGQALEDILDLANLFVPELGARGAARLNTAKKAVEAKIQSGEFTVPQVKTFVETRVANTALKDLENLKTKYSKLRNSRDFDTESLQRIADAQAKTGFLNGAVDADGTIITKASKIADIYRQNTIDGSEGVVRKLLQREGATVNLSEVRRAILEAVDSKFEGSDLVAAIRGIDKEIAGLAQRADEFGNLTLDKIQDIKIASTKYLDYDKPAASEFKKLKGSVYRQIIEDKSRVSIDVDGTPRTIKDINKELAKYYRDISNIEALDGLKAPGGRLGKYASQLLGAVIGTSAGSVGGAFGGAIGGLIGAEAGGALRSAQMQRMFGRGFTGDIPENQLLTKAKAESATPAVVDLKKPDVRVGAPAGVPKTKEIVQVESRIAKNVQAQKKAIAAGDFTLVAVLKDVYKALVEKLKELIEKASSGTVRGFARLDMGQSKNEGNLKKAQTDTTATAAKMSNIDGNATTKGADLQGIPPELRSLAQEARKYKSAEEFVDDLTNPSPDYEAPTIDGIYYHGDAFNGGKSALTLDRSISLSPDPSFAKWYASRTADYEKTLRPFQLSPQAKVLDLRSAGTIDGAKMDAAIEQAKSGKYDAVRFNTTPPSGIGSGEELHVINTKVVKELDKSQLTDLWNKAQGTQIGTNDRVRLISKETGQSQERIVKRVDGDTLVVTDDVSGIPYKATPEKWSFELIKKGDPTKPFPKGIGINSPEMVALEAQGGAKMLELDLADAVSKELTNYDSTPLTVNGKMDLSSSDVDFRLMELKNIVEKKALTKEQVQEAADLLKQVGIDVTK